MHDRSLLRRLQRFQQFVLQFPAGHHWAALVSRHFDEVLRLINTNRRVATIWHRNGGPALVRAALTLAEDPARASIPAGVGGVPLALPLDRIFDSWRRLALAPAGRRHRSLSRRGPDPPGAIAAIDPHGPLLRGLTMATKAGTLELIARELGQVLAPLEQRLTGGGALELLGAVGVRLPDSVASHAQVASAITGAATHAAGARAKGRAARRGD